MIHSQGLPTVYHGSSTFSPTELTGADGLPLRGNDIDLIRHIEPPTTRAEESAFRGTVPFPSYPAITGSAVDWAGEGGWIFQVSDWRGYDVNAELEGRIPDGKGGFRGPLMEEQEIAIPARVPARFVTRVGKVKRGRIGLVVDWE